MIRYSRSINTSLVRTQQPARSELSPLSVINHIVVLFCVLVRVLGNDLTIFPHVIRRAVPARHFSRRPCSTTHPRDRRRRQNFLASLAIYDVWSWAALQQLWFRFGILIYRPMICQRLIHLKEIGPASLESSDHISTRDIMAALPDTARLGTASARPQLRTDRSPWNQLPKLKRAKKWARPGSEHTSRARMSAE